MKWSWKRESGQALKSAVPTIGFGDELPAVLLQEGAPENYVGLTDSANVVVVGVPGKQLTGFPS